MMFNPLGEGLALVWDLVAMFISIIAVMMVVQINGAIQKSGRLSSDVTRKLVHIFAAPVFVATWLLYSGSMFSRYLAAIVPILFVLLFVGIGTGRVENEAFVASMSRSGDPAELLKGTLYYAIMIVVTTIVWFTEPSGNASALIIFGCLAGGDGLADIIGRKYGGDRKFGIGGSEKTIAGSIGMFVGSFLFSFILMVIFSIQYSYDLVGLLLPVVVLSVIAMVVEAVTPPNLDNWTISIGIAIVLALMSILAPALWPLVAVGGVATIAMIGVLIVIQMAPSIEELEAYLNEENTIAIKGIVTKADVETISREKTGFTQGQEICYELDSFMINTPDGEFYVNLSHTANLDLSEGDEMWVAGELSDSSIKAKYLYYPPLRKEVKISAIPIVAILTYILIWISAAIISVPAGFLAFMIGGFGFVILVLLLHLRFWNYREFKKCKPEKWSKITQVFDRSRQ
ncbi:hypothetical protein EU520_00875 [Candidatus Thorarchaeota archaeon]|nr:MAG: hypothetical protein EU520_00875 [Candidatus Thorarchaeota archaeon]